MYSHPSTSMRREPFAWSTTRGVPPTARNARTGLSTPPTRIFCARSKSSAERGRAFCSMAGSSAGLEPASDVLSVIREDDGCTCALDAGHNFEDDTLLVDPTLQRRGFHHRIFRADIVGGDGNVESLANSLDHVEI